MPTLRDLMQYQTGIDPETLRMFELFFGGQSRLPGAEPTRKKTQKAAKPTTKVRPGLSILPDDVISAGGRRVEAEDIAMHFNNALAAGAGMKAFDAIPPELREGILTGLVNKSSKKKEKTKKPKPPKVPAPEKFTKLKMARELQQTGMSRPLAEIMVENALKGGGGLTAKEWQAIPEILEARQRIHGTTGTVRDSQTATPTKRQPTEKYYEVVSEQTANGPRRKYQLATRAKRTPWEKAPEDRTYWDLSRMGAEYNAPDMHTDFASPYQPEQRMQKATKQMKLPQDRKLFPRTTEQVLSGLLPNLLDIFEGIVDQIPIREQSEWLRPTHAYPLHPQVNDETLGYRYPPDMYEPSPAIQQKTLSQRPQLDVKGYMYGQGGPGMPRSPETLRMPNLMPSNQSVGPPYDVQNYFRGGGGPGMVDQAGDPFDALRGLMPLLNLLYDPSSPSYPFDVKRYMQGGG